MPSPSPSSSNLRKTKTVSTAKAMIEIADQVFGGGDSEIAATALKERQSLWSSIRRCIAVSPLSRRNTKRRARAKWAVSTVKERLSDVEQLVDLAADILMTSPCASPSASPQSSPSTLWRRKLSKNRAIVRQFRDEILTQILAENARLRAEVRALTEKSNVDELDSDHLLGIEEKYKELAHRQKRDQRAMKEMEVAIKGKTAEIHTLREQVIALRTLPAPPQSPSHSSAKRLSIDGLSRLKGEIALTKLSVQRQLQSMTNVAIDL